MEKIYFRIVTQQVCFLLIRDLLNRHFNENKLKNLMIGTFFSLQAWTLGMFDKFEKS